MTEEQKPQETEEKKPEWVYREKFAINGHMQEVIQATIKVAQGEIERQRKKLRRLMYGA